MGIWDVELKDEVTTEYSLLPAGTYAFEVVDCKAKEYVPKQGSKMPNCGQLDVRLRVESDKDYTVFDSMFTAESAVWRMTQFAKSIGIFHKGLQPLELAKACVGQIGNCEIVIDEYNHKKRNKVKTYLEATKQEPQQVGLSFDEKDLPF